LVSLCRSRSELAISYFYSIDLTYVKWHWPILDMVRHMPSRVRPGRREQQAAETRRLIIDAARRLFATQGYGITSIAQIAEEAGVAIPTIYASVGTKLRLLELLNDRIDADADVAELVPLLLACQDAAQMLELQVRLSRQLNERAGDLIAALRSAATVEPDMAGPYTAGIHRHLQGMHATARRLSELGALRAGMSEHEAAALLDSLLAPETWATLTAAHHLSWDASAELLSQSLGILLLNTPASGPAPEPTDGRS